MAFRVMIINRGRGAYLFDVVMRKIVFQRAAQHVFLVPVEGLLRVIDVERKIGEGFDAVAVQGGHLDRLVVVTETGGLINIEFEFVVHGHVVDHAINQVIRVARIIDVALSGLTAIVLAPAQPMFTQGCHNVHRGCWNSLQQAGTGEVGAESEIFKRHRLRIAVTRDRAG